MRYLAGFFIAAEIEKIFPQQYILDKQELNYCSFKTTRSNKA